MWAGVGWGRDGTLNLSDYSESKSNPEESGFLNFNKILTNALCLYYQFYNYIRNEKITNMAKFFQ